VTAPAMLCRLADSAIGAVVAIVSTSGEWLTGSL
jgi:hypothetical protein